MKLLTEEQGEQFRHRLLVAIVVLLAYYLEVLAGRHYVDILERL